MQYILFVILSFLIGTILFYLSNNKCEPFTIGNDIQLSQNLNLTSKSPCECDTELPTSISEEFTIGVDDIYKVTGITSIYGLASLTNEGTLCIEPDAELFVYGEFKNKGKIYNNASINNTGRATFTNSSGATITNNGYIDNNESATFTNSSGATITNLIEGTGIANCATFNNLGEIRGNGIICSIHEGNNMPFASIELCTQSMLENRCSCYDLSKENCKYDHCELNETDKCVEASP